MLNTKQKEILSLIHDEPYMIGIWAGFKDLTPLHNEWLRSFLYGREDQTLLGHRGSYKTTVLSVFLALHLITEPDESVIFFRKTDDDVNEVMRQTKNLLESPVFGYMVYELYGREMKVTKATNSEINTNLKSSIKGASQIVGLGIKTSITGKHADIVITDDIVNLKDRISRPEREQTKLQYQELQNIRNRGGRFINTGTPWHKEDAISLMPNIKKYDCYSTGLISREKIEELRKSMSDSLFAANYELKHIADADALFKDPKFIQETSLIYGGMAHLDAAYGGSDYTAYTIMRKLEDGRTIAFGKLWHKHVDDCLDQIESCQEKYRAGSIACELNADKGYLSKELRNRGLRPFTYTEHQNKYIKISTYLRREWENLYWLEDTDPEYISQVLDYSEFAEHDDAPDSAASLIRRMEKQGTFYTIKGGL